MRKKAGSLEGETSQVEKRGGQKRDDSRKPL